MLLTKPAHPFAGVNGELFGHVVHILSPERLPSQNLAERHDWASHAIDAHHTEDSSFRFACAYIYHFTRQSIAMFY